MIKKAYIFINKESRKGEYGWVYVTVPGCEDNSIAVELIDYDTYYRALMNSVEYKEPFLKEDLIEMPQHALEQFEEYYGDIESDNIVKEIIDASRVQEKLR